MHFIFISTGRPAYQPKYIFHLLHRVCAWAGICHSNFHMLYTSVYAQCNMTLHLDFYAWINRQIKQAIVVCTYICIMYLTDVARILFPGYLIRILWAMTHLRPTLPVVSQISSESCDSFQLGSISLLHQCSSVTLSYNIMASRHVTPPHVTGCNVQSRLIFIHHAFVYYVQPRQKKLKHFQSICCGLVGEVVWSPLCVCAGPLSAACLPVEVTG